MILHNESITVTSQNRMKKMTKYNIDILDLCEMRWSSNGKLKEEGITIIYSVHSKNQIPVADISQTIPIGKALTV